MTDPRDLAVQALAHLVDRDLAYVGADVVLPFASHHAAVSEIAAARLIVEAARRCAVGRAVDRPGDLVPLANGRSVDLGGRWTMPK